ncbi:hypothetical protein [Oceanobacillus sp. CAU 1775]
MKKFLLLLFVSCTFLLVACSEEPSEKVAAYQDNFEILGEERDELIGDVSDTIYESIDRDATDPEEIFLSSIGKDGVQITPPAGRYWIGSMGFSGAPESGRIVVYDEDDKLLIDQLYDQGFGGSSVTVDLNGTHTVHIDGLNEAQITPVETEFYNELTSGIWEVGKDVEAGEYDIMGTDYGFGYLHVFEEGKEPRVFEFLNSSPDSQVRLELKAGQKLRVSSVFIQLTPVP